MKPDLCKWEMRDPLVILISREQAQLKRTCKGCCHVKTVESPFGDEVPRCLKGRPYGKKCNRYEVTKCEN